MLAGRGDPRRVHDELAAAGHRRRCSTTILALVPDAWLLPDPTRPDPQAPADAAGGPGRLPGLPAGPAGGGRPVAAVSAQADRPHAFQYAVLRAVPRVDRGEFVNVGVILYCQALDYPAGRGGGATTYGCGRLAADVDLDAVRRSAEAVVDACREPVGSARENTGLATRFGMLTAPRSTVVQPSPVHAGVTARSRAHAGRLLAQAGRSAAADLRRLHLAPATRALRTGAVLGGGEQLAAVGQGRPLPAVALTPARSRRRRSGARPACRAAWMPRLGQQPVELADRGRAARRRRRAMSASSEATVSTASDLLVPITPVGPRLIQPVTYSSAEKPPSRITRPSACGTRPVLVVERHPGQRQPAVADRADHQLRRRSARLARCPRRSRRR